MLGDKRAAGTSRRLGPKRIHVLNELQKLFEVPIKLIHIIRNPYDNIATMALRLAGGKLRDSAFKGVDIQVNALEKVLHR